MIEHQRLGSYERNNVDDIQAEVFLEKSLYALRLEQVYQHFSIGNRLWFGVIIKKDIELIGF